MGGDDTRFVESFGVNFERGETNDSSIYFEEYVDWKIELTMVKDYILGNIQCNNKFIQIRFVRKVRHIRPPCAIYLYSTVCVSNLNIVLYLQTSKRAGILPEAVRRSMKSAPNKCKPPKKIKILSLQLVVSD